MWALVAGWGFPSTSLAEEASRPVRRALAGGLDVRVGAPAGAIGGATVGLDLVLQPFGPLAFQVGADTNGATVSVHGDVQVNLLTFFTADAWTPFVRGGLAHLRFTRAADRLMDTVAPTARADVQAYGTDLRLAGTYLNLARVSAGIDCLTEGGFHFQLAVGRALLLGESGGGDDWDTVVITAYQSWTFDLAVGWRFW